jgi:hypothetical protein
VIGAVIRHLYETWTYLMAMRSLWKIWVEAKSEDNALRVSERVRHLLGREAVDQDIAPYPKIMGFLVVFWVGLEGEAWNDCVVELIELGQRVGHEWMLSGDILGDPSGWSNKPRVPGVRAIEWLLIMESTATTPEATSA